MKQKNGSFEAKYPFFTNEIPTNPTSSPKINLLSETYTGEKSHKTKTFLLQKCNGCRYNLQDSTFTSFSA